MVNRRQFLEAGAATSLAAALARSSIAHAHEAIARAGGAIQPSPLSPAPDGRASGTLHRELAVVFDERFAAARRFGETMHRRGLAVHAIRGDVTAVWYSYLHPLWKRTPAPVAGLTAYAAMFCLERLAWDHGLRMIHLGAQSESGALDPSLYSWLIAPSRAATALAATIPRTAPDGSR